MKLKHYINGLSLFTAAAALLGAAAPARAAARKPNILVIWGDDIGNQNISHNCRGLMGYKTPNIDRIAKEGNHSSAGGTPRACTSAPM